MDPLEQKRNGYSLADCADIMRNHSSLKLQYGEPGFHGPWQEFLRSRGLTEAQWAHVWNDWWQILQSDNALAAKFHTYSAQASARALVASQPNVSQNAMEGVTLEQFAKIGALTQAGQDTAALVAAEGLTMDQWLRGQAAWGQKMGTISPTDPIMMQYGQLYQRYNSRIPTAGGGSVSMEQATENVLDKHSQVQGNRAISATVANAESEFFSSPIVRHKARGVREILNLWDRSSETRASDPALRQATQRAYDISIDLLGNGPGNGPGTGPGYQVVSGSADPVDIHRWGDMHTEEEAYSDTVQTVFSAFKDLASAEFMTPAQSEHAKAAISAAIQRLQPRRAHVEAIFQGTQDITKKSSLRTLLDDYTSLLGELQEALDDWSYTGPEESAAASPASMNFGAPPPSTGIAASGSSSSLLDLLRGLPIIGQILKMLGL